MENHREFQKKYSEAYKLCSNLLSTKLKSRGISPEKAKTNLIQSILNSPEIVKYLINNKYDENELKPILLEAIESTRKELFPDLAKKRFISLDKIELEAGENLTSEVIQDSIDNEISTLLSKKSKVYLKNISSKSVNTNYFPVISKESVKIFEHNIDAMSKYFPKGNIPDINTIDVTSSLSSEGIISIYKCILCGIERKYPKNFLKFEAKKRSAILIQFLVHDVLKLKTEDILFNLSEEVLRKYKLQNVFRLFNYSIRQTCYNAFPALQPEWMETKGGDSYWTYKPNRVKAVKWLVEEQLKIHPSSAGKFVVSKKDFIENGFSYLFTTHYNSVSKALTEAYPWIEAWQTSNIKAEFWSQENAHRALKWMFNKLGWEIVELPRHYSNGNLNRKTFSRFGLAGLFEKKYGCNIFNAISDVWPGRFKPWEFGHIQPRFWESSKNKLDFAKWTVEKLKIDLDSPERYLDFQLFEEKFQNYKFFSGIKKQFANDISQIILPLKAHREENEKSLLLSRKWEMLIKEEKENMLFSNILLAGIFSGIVKTISKHRIATFTRIKKRHYRLN